MANVTLGSSDDFFKELFKLRLSNCVGLATNFIFGPFSVMMLFGISWYERNGSDAKQTILNKLLTLVGEGTIWYGIFGQIPEIFRYLYGPFPLWFCRYHLLVKSVILLNGWSFLCSSIVLRYCFIFVLKNPGRFNDDFWMLFLKILIPVLNFLANFAHIFLPGSESIRQP